MEQRPKPPRVPPTKPLGDPLAAHRADGHPPQPQRRVPARQMTRSELIGKNVHELRELRGKIAVESDPRRLAYLVTQREIKKQFLDRLFAEEKLT